jgi:hypothetical protein
MEWIDREAERSSKLSLHFENEIQFSDIRKSNCSATSTAARDIFTKQKGDVHICVTG